jgi:hypothetical protein
MGRILYFELHAEYGFRGGAPAHLEAGGAGPATSSFAKRSLYGSPGSRSLESAPSEFSHA